MMERKTPKSYKIVLSQRNLVAVVAMIDIELQCKSEILWIVSWQTK